MTGSERKLWILVILFSGAVIFFLSTLAWYAYEPAPSPAKLSPTRSSGAREPYTNPSHPTSDPFDSPFSSAMDRLNHAFQNHPALDVEEMITIVNSQTPPGQQQPCRLSWRDNEATLSIRSDKPYNLSPTEALTTCADAIERLP